MATEKRLIDANALVNVLGDLKSNLYGWEDYNTGVDSAVYTVENAPTEDAVEVVRCKECKHWKPGDSMMGNSFGDMQRVGSCEYVRFRRLENDFCSYGERRPE